MEHQALRTFFKETYGYEPSFYAAAPGRTEIGGNHTDHQHGCVLAAAVNLVTEAAVSPSGRNEIRILSEGYPAITVQLDDLSPDPDKYGTTVSLVRGVAERFVSLGYPIPSGFDAVITSTVLPGSGLSSSAAFEVLIGTIINHLYANDSVSAVDIAVISQYAENVHFGKPCGLMDQMASSVGGIIGIDFEHNDKPQIEKINFSFLKHGYSLCIIDSGADHANLTNEYAAIPQEMRSIARLFGKEYLREIDDQMLHSNINEAREKCGDRAVLRAMHFFAENHRVEKEISALKNGDICAFLETVNASGRSSWNLLQNVVAAGEIRHQHMALALACAEKLLSGEGAFRVHGGGFAGTIQAFVPVTKLDSFKYGIERILGEGSCHVLDIRNEGGVIGTL